MTVLLFLVSFVYYLTGLSGTVPSYRDSGDLVASVYTLGIAHPPGYALYVLLGKLFVTLIPFGNIAYRVNVMSAFFAAAAIAVLFFLLKKLSGDRAWGALVITVLYAATPAVVALARVAEMYTLAALIAAAILYCLFSDVPNGFSWAALLLGLGLSVHLTLIFLIPLFFVSPARMLWRSAALSFLLGLSVFLYLPLRAAQHPLLNWGDPSSWRNFWRVVTRADYGGLKLHPQESVFSWTPESFWAQLHYFAGAFHKEWGWGALVVGAVGIGFSLKESKTRSISAGLLISWTLAGPAFFILSNLPLQEATTPAILQPYLVLVNLLWAPFVVWGFYALCPKRITMYAAAAALTLALISTRSWAWTSERNDFYAYDYARNLLRSLPPQAVLYNPDDPTHFSILVLQILEKRRPDVVLLNFFRTRWGYEQIKRRWPDLLPPIPIESGQELERLLWTYSIHQRPFYAELPQKFGSIPYHAEGLVYSAQTGLAQKTEQESESRAQTLLALYVQRGDFVTTDHADFFTRHIISYYAAAYNNLGIEYTNRGEWPKALALYQEALRIEPDQTAALNNRAIALQKMRKLL